MRARRTSSTTLAVVGVAFLALVSTSAHTVRSGDTLGGIARRHGISVAALAQINRLADPNLIRVGQVLTVPAGGSGSSGIRPPAGAASTHVVRAGDTLGGIARRYAIPTSQIVAANGLTGDRIYIGQQLRLTPAAGTPPSGGGSHVVRAGDTLSGIARRFATTVRAIQDANAIRDPDRVTVGRKLRIPAGGAGRTLRCPVQGGARFGNDWGFPRSGGRFHEGTDLFAPRGRPAVAVVSGTVVQTIGRLGGNQVKLAGDDGVSYSYTHLGGFGARGRVSAGTVIGYVGNSGNAAGGPTHVHFEVHPGGGAAVNPYPRVSGVC